MSTSAVSRDESGESSASNPLFPVTVIGERGNLATDRAKEALDGRLSLGGTRHR
jgi:hypothetical protein